MKPNLDKNLIVAGGGTGGHVLAGIAIAQEWKSKFPNSKILFVGAKGGLEETLVPRAGLSLELIGLGSLKGVGITKKMKTILQLPRALWRAWGLIADFEPAAVIGVGGYASGPVVMMARLVSKARVAILEQNAVAGLTNRILSHFAHKIFLAFPAGKDQFPEHKTLVTGNPIRQEFSKLPMPTENPPVVFVFGGSQGAMGINTLIIESLPLIKKRGLKINMIHQTGPKDYERVKAAHEHAQSGAQVEKFIYEMKETYAKAALLVCRAGASTLSEVASVGRPSILIPFPQATDNHQELNAQGFVSVGAAVLLKQGQTTAEQFVEVLSNLLDSPRKLAEMAEKSSQLFTKDAARNVINALL